MSFERIRFFLCPIQWGVFDKDKTITDDDRYQTKNLSTDGAQHCDTHPPSSPLLPDHHRSLSLLCSALPCFTLVNMMQQKQTRHIVHYIVGACLDFCDQDLANMSKSITLFAANTDLGETHVTPSAQGSVLHTPLVLFISIPLN